LLAINSTKIIPELIIFLLGGKNRVFFAESGARKLFLTDYPQKAGIESNEEPKEKTETAINFNMDIMGVAVAICFD
jgi:hypothetical protein